MLSQRLVWHQPPNPLSRLLAEKRAAGAKILDLTESNPTRAQLPYPPGMLASLADDALSHPVTPLFITPSEMIDVAESELLSHRVSAVSGALPAGENAVALAGDDSDALHELDHWLGMLQGLSQNEQPQLVADLLTPVNFAVASYRASMLPLIGDPNESALQGATGTLARLPLQWQIQDKMKKVQAQDIAAMSVATIVRLAASHSPRPYARTGSRRGSRRAGQRRPRGSFRRPRRPGGRRVLRSVLSVAHDGRGNNSPSQGSRDGSWRRRPPGHFNGPSPRCQSSRVRRT